MTNGIEGIEKEKMFFIFAKKIENSGKLVDHAWIEDHATLEEAEASAKRQDEEAEEHVSVSVYSKPLTEEEAKKELQELI